MFKCLKCVLKTKAGSIINETSSFTTTTRRNSVNDTSIDLDSSLKTAILQSLARLSLFLIWGGAIGDSDNKSGNKKNKICFLDKHILVRIRRKPFQSMRQSIIYFNSLYCNVRKSEQVYCQSRAYLTANNLNWVAAGNVMFNHRRTKCRLQFRRRH